MSTAINPAGTAIPVLTEEDKMALDQRLHQLRRIHDARPKHFQPPPGMTDEVAISAARHAFDMETQSLIREQIEIIAKLRRTSAGPPKKGGTRAKKAPLDLGSLMANLMSNTQ